MKRFVDVEAVLAEVETQMEEDAEAAIEEVESLIGQGDLDDIAFDVLLGKLTHQIRTGADESFAFEVSAAQANVPKSFGRLLAAMSERLVPSARAPHNASKGG